MGSSQSQDGSASKYMLGAPNPNAWQRLPTHGISPVFLPQLFSPALLPAFVAILQSFYALDFCQALEECKAFVDQLNAIQHQLGPGYDTTVRCYSIVRLMIHIEMGFYRYPTDLPFPNPPHLESVPDPKLPVSDAYVVHRLLSACFDNTERAASELGEHGWDYDKSNSMVKNNLGFFKHVLPRITPKRDDFGPVPDLHIWFWVYFVPYLTKRRQLFVSSFSSLNRVEETFAKFWPTLLSRLAAQNRPELVFQLCRKQNDLNLYYSGNHILPYQALLQNASTRFQYIAARHSALVSRPSSLTEKGKIPQGAIEAEMVACEDICKQSGFLALSADLADRHNPEDFDLASTTSAIMESSGLYDNALSIDAHRVELLLNKADATVRLVAGDQARRILKDMLDRESFLMGEVDPRNGHQSCLFTHLARWSATLLRQRAQSMAVVSLVATFSIEAHHRAVTATRAPPWRTGQAVLAGALALLGHYRDSVYAHVSAPQFLVKMMMDVAWELLKHAKRITPEVASEVSSAATCYIALAGASARWGDTSGLARRLEAVQAFADAEIARDLRRREYKNAVVKCTVIIEICLYHPGRMHMQNIWDTGSAYDTAQRLLANDTLWEKNQEGLAEARVHFTRVEGVWLGWTDPAGRFRESGAPRRVPGEPQKDDFWTYDWMSLGLDPLLRYNPVQRQEMIAAQASRDMAASVRSMGTDTYLKDSINVNTALFNEPPKGHGARWNREIEERIWLA